MDKIVGMQRLDISQLQQNNPLLRQHGGTGISVATNSFSESLKVAIQDVDKLQRVSDTKLELLASGKDVDIHGTMIALQEADISIRTMGAFKDKITEVYKTLINMQI